MPEPHILLTVVAGTPLGNPAVQRRLAGGRLPEAGGQHATHQDFVDVAGPNAGALQRRLDGSTAEVNGTEAGKFALEGANRRARHADDDDGVLSCCGHVLARVLRVGLALGYVDQCWRPRGAGMPAAEPPRGRR